MNDLMQVIERLEQQIRDAHKENGRLVADNAKLKSATDLQAVQSQLDAFIAQTTQKFEMQLTSFKEMVKGLNTEGVRRYEGAVKAVNSHTDYAVERMLIKIEELQFLPDENLQNTKN
jgi:hypothetical protein